MKSLECKSALVAFALFLSTPLVTAKHGHANLERLERRYHNHHKSHPLVSRAEDGLQPSDLAAVERRGGQCQFPTDAGLVAVTPGSQNAGWAMSPDQPCLPGHYCPYACPPGQLMAQWDPKATSYSYPASMNGGLYCDESGTISKPFPNKPYCVDGTGSVGCTNKAGGNIAVCQTVLPGNEAMLIPTNVEDWAGLAVPDTSYWASTAAHYYINPPGYSVEEACVWGTKDKPIGNWSPYVAGANADDSGLTFLKVGWNPIYLEPATPFRDVMPEWGVKIECEGDGCNGLPCEIDPAKHKVNECSGTDTPGAGGATFCVVTVPKGVKANVVVFGQGGAGGSDSKKAAPSPSPKPSPSPSPKPSPSSTSSTTSSSSSSSSSKTSSKSSSSSSSTTTSANSTTAHHSSTSASTTYSLRPQIFVENSTYTSTSASESSSAAAVTPPSPTKTKKSAAVAVAIPQLGFAISIFLGAFVGLGL